MTRRKANKCAARIARDHRWGLVHAAGCTYSHAEVCATLQELVERPVQAVEFYVAEFSRLGVKPRRVSVPRSLRPLLGRYVGGVPPVPDDTGTT